MSKKLIENIEYMLSEKIDPSLGNVVDMALEQAPLIGKVITSFKIHRLGVRLKKHEKQIEDLKEQVSKIDDQQFVYLIKNFLFPSVLQELLEEDEDNKIGYFLNGFGCTINDRDLNKDKILIYFDLLRKLRFIEIEYLISLSNESKRHRNDIYYKTGKLTEDPFSNESFKEMQSAVNSKLESLGLIDTGRIISYGQIMRQMKEDSWRAQRRMSSSSIKEETKVTTFGDKFLHFFCLLDRFK